MGTFFTTLNFKSLAFKSAIIYFLIFLTGLSLVGVLMLRYSSKSIIESAEGDIKHTTELVRVKIEEYLDRVESDIQFLSTNPELSSYLINPSTENEARLSKSYLALIDSKQDYSQIRFISNDNRGSEVVRVDRKNNRCFTVDRSKLQSKGDRPYVKETLLLSSDKTYFSPIDLNKEFGQISTPHTPTLRVAKSIIVQGEVKGVVVINTNLSKLFESLEGTVNQDYFLRILNGEGYYLMHEKEDSTFLFEFSKPLKPQFDLHKLDKQKSRLYEMGDEMVMAFNSINYGEKHEELVYFVVADKKKALSAYRKWRRDSMIIILIIGLLFTALAFYALARQSKTLIDITNRLRDFPYNREIKNLPVNRQDEIGGLAKSLNEMASIINDQLDSINSEKLKAEQAVHEKQEFIENISHEIRNPLQSIMGLSSMLEKNNPNSNQLDIINSLKFNTTNLLGLVNNILDYQNVIRGQIDVNYVWTDITQLVNEVVMGNKYSAVEKGIQLLTDFDKEVYRYDIKTDKLRLSQILGNLIGNAIKFTPPKGIITVGVSLSGSNLQISVKDTGIGMTSQEVERIRERYFTNKGIQTLTSNFGLGLTIVSELLNLLGSRIKVHSKKDEGSVFFFGLDVEKRISVEKKTDDQFHVKDVDIIVVEDDLQITNLYKHLLSGVSPTPTFTSDYQSIKETKQRFDLVISDFRFNEGNLLDNIHYLNQIMKPDSNLIIASATSHDISILESKFDKVFFIKKPFNNSAFKYLLNKIVITTRYGEPNIDSIKSDYDNNKEKYTKALLILIEEWEGISRMLINAINNNDQILMEATFHKFVTSLRRLKLEGLENLLSDIQSAMPMKQVEQSEISNKLNHIMLFYKEWLKNNI